MEHPPASPNPRMRGSFRALAGAALVLALPVRVVAQDPTDLGELRRQVEAREYRTAQSALERWVREHPRDGDAWELLGRCREGRWIFDEAAEAYQKALDYKGESSELLVRWVSTRAQSLNILSAIFKVARLRDAAARALELEPLNLEARIALAAYYEVLPGIVGGDKAKANRLVEELVRLSPADGYAMQGIRADSQGKPDSVKVNRFDAALRLEPTNKGALLALGLHWIEQGDQDRGFAFYERAVSAWPDDPQVWLSFGRAHRRVDQDGEAAENFRRALEIDAFYAPARFGLAEYYEELGNRREALRHYTLLANYNPTYKEREVRQRVRRLTRP